MFSILKWFKKRESKPTAQNAVEFPSVKNATKWLDLQIFHVCGYDGTFFCVKIKNKALSSPHWEMFSPRFENYGDALLYLTSFLMPHNNLGKRRIVFMESLMRNARKNHVESLYYYVRDTLKYFNDCLFASRENIVVQFFTQMTGMVDEYFNCIYNLRNEIFINDIEFIMERNDYDDPLKILLKFNLNNICINKIPLIKE